MDINPERKQNNFSQQATTHVQLNFQQQANNTFPLASFIWYRRAVIVQDVRVASFLTVRCGVRGATSLWCCSVQRMVGTCMWVATCNDI